MRKIISDETWLQIKTEYQLGKGVRELERKYDVPNTTIMSRKKKENWTQESSARMLELQEATENFVQTFEQSQLPFVQDKLKEILDISAKVKSFISSAVDINIKNIQEVANEPDLKDRIRMISMMKATISDLANVYPTTVKQDDKEEQEEDHIINVIIK